MDFNKWVNIEKNSSYNPLEKDGKLPLGDTFKNGCHHKEL